MKKTDRCDLIGLRDHLKDQTWVAVEMREVAEQALLVKIIVVK
jgi:hypothetical protein